MRLLLDTHTLLWAIEGNPKLSAKAAKALEDPEAEVYVSAASMWELAIKAGLGKLELALGMDGTAAALTEAGVRELPIHWRHSQALADLPRHHGDPFDRLLAAQALAEDMVLVSADKAFKPYKVRVLW